MSREGNGERGRGQPFCCRRGRVEERECEGVCRVLFKSWMILSVRSGVAVSSISR